MSGLCHGVMVIRPYVGCMVPGRDVISCQIAHESSITETKMAKESLLNPPRNNIEVVLDETEIA